MWGLWSAYVSWLVHHDSAGRRALAAALWLLLHQVRIVLDPADGVLGHLRPGLSVTAEVDTRKEAETPAVARAP